MVRRPLGNTGLDVTPIGFGAFKIGRAEGIKYPTGYDLPTDEQAAALLNAVLDMGINVIDTAPAYGLSEQRIGEALGHRREEYVLCTKVGETFADGRSTYDFTAAAVRAGITRSLQRLKTDVLDVVHIHSNGDDLHIMRHTDCVPTLIELRDRGLIRAIGLSGKTAEGFRDSFEWADVAMIEYNPANPELADIITEAHQQGIGAFIKKGLASGHLPAADAIRFVLHHPAADCLVLGGLSLDHLAANVRAALEVRS